MNKLVMLLALLCSIPARAEEALILGLHTFSKHFPTEDYQHNDNFGVFGEYKGWRLGAYDNTLGRTSVYGGYHYQLGYGFGVMAGIVSGYQKKCEEVVTRRTETTIDPDSRMTLSVTYIKTTETCYGTSRGAITGLMAFSYTPPPRFNVWGVQPEILFMPPLFKNASVVHLALKF